MASNMEKRVKKRNFDFPLLIVLNVIFTEVNIYHVSHSVIILYHDTILYYQLSCHMHESWSGQHFLPTCILTCFELLINLHLSSPQIHVIKINYVSYVFTPIQIINTYIKCASLIGY